MYEPTISIVGKPSVENQPRVMEIFLAPKDLLVKSQNTIDLWFQIFYDILDDEQLTKKFQNALKVNLEVEGIQEELVVSNLPERHIGRVKRREHRY
jgi:hypothetical protein